MNKLTASIFSFVFFLVALSTEPIQAEAADVAQLPQIVPASPTRREWSALKAELLKMLETDQKHREALVKADEAAWDKFLKKQRPIDAKNQLRLEEIISKFGWPGVSKVGRKGVLTVFLVIQHAPLTMMKRHFSAARAAMENGEMEKPNFALLDDRIRMNEGRPQLYGSQIQVDPETDKSMIWKIEDEANVDKRRAKMGLSPMIEYAKIFGIDYVAVKPSADEAMKQ